MQLINSEYAVIPSAFMEFDNGFTFIKNYKYQHLNNKARFIKVDTELKKQVACIGVRVVIIFDNRIVINQGSNKLNLGFSYGIFANAPMVDPIKETLLKMLETKHKQINFNKTDLRCIGLLKDATIGNDAEIVFELRIKEKPNILMMTSEETKTQLLLFDQQSRFIIEQINSIIQKKNGVIKDIT